MKIAMVIVGTTNFDRLIETLDDPIFYEIFIKHGFTEIVFQIGKFLIFVTYFNGKNFF